MGNSASAFGLVCCSIPILVHGPEVWNPSLTRFVANLWLPPFTLNVPYTFRPEEAIDYTEQIDMLKAFLAKAPTGKEESAKDLLFLMLFETRQGSIGFWAAALGAAYAFTLPLEQRHPIHFVFFVLSVVMTLANANHGLKFPFGKHPFVSKNGSVVGIAFAPFWIVSAYCNWTAMTQGRGLAGFETCAAKS